MGQHYSVYALIDPQDKLVRYVGYSAHVQRRYKEHCRGESSIAVAHWVQALKEQGLTPVLRIVEEDILDEPTAWKREWYWTDVFLRDVAPLLNNISDSIREEYAQRGIEHSW